MTLLRRLEDAERKQLYIEYRIAAANEAAKELIPQGITPSPPSGTTKVLGTPAPWPPGAQCDLLFYGYAANTGAPLNNASVSVYDETTSPNFQYDAHTNAAGLAYFVSNTNHIFHNGDNCHAWGVAFSPLRDFTLNTFTINALSNGVYYFSAGYV